MLWTQTWRLSLRPMVVHTLDSLKVCKQTSYAVSFLFGFTRLVRSNSTYVSLSPFTEPPGHMDHMLHQPMPAEAIPAHMRDQHMHNAFKSFSDAQKVREKICSG